MKIAVNILEELCALRTMLARTRIRGVAAAHLLVALHALGFTETADDYCCRRLPLLLFTEGEFKP